MALPWPTERTRAGSVRVYFVLVLVLLSGGQCPELIALCRSSQHTRAAESRVESEVRRTAPWREVFSEPPPPRGDWI